MIYLASPYTHPDSSIRHKRAAQAARAAQQLARAGYAVFAPVPYSVSVIGEETLKTHKEWLEFDVTFLAFSDEMVILAIDGWDRSKGIYDEVQFALRFTLPITVWNPDLPFETRERIDNFRIMEYSLDEPWIRRKP